MRFLLVTVTDASARSGANLDALLASVQRQGEPVELVLVMRGAVGSAREQGAGDPPIHLIERELAISLSRARNDALAHARAQGLLEDAEVIAFPDDDCRYPDGLLTRVAAQLAGEAQVVAGSYGPSAQEIDWRCFPNSDLPLSPALVMRTTSSNNVFFTARAIAAIGEFDERFGLGARYGAAEDTDYVLRALRLGLQGVYRPRAVFVEHPYKPHRPTQYYLGNLAAEAKHAIHGGTPVRLARRLAFGLTLMARGQMTPREYAHGIRAAASMLSETLTRP